MSFSSFDFISPKITLYYNGHNSHISRIGGLLSLCLIIIIFIIIFYSFWDLIEKKYSTSFIYEQNIINNQKIFHKFNQSGISHFIQIYSNINNGSFGDIDNKNIIIYGIKENNNIIDNNNFLNLDLLNIEHWLYDKCDTIADIYPDFFSKISNIVRNHSLSICLRFYYNPTYKKYYQIGNEGYIDPKLETNNVNEKKYSYKIIINKCYNNTFINNYMGYICNPEYEINKYFNIYKEIFLYFSDNKIIPFYHKNHIETSFYSISSSLQQSSFFENNILFLPTKLSIKKGYIIRSHKDLLSYTLNSYDINENLNNSENPNLIGIFNFYLDNKIFVYDINCSNILDLFSHLGGLVRILFFIFEMFNYINHHYTMIEDTKELFKITSGIDSIYDSKDINLDNIRYISTKNYKIKATNTNDNLSRNHFSPIINKKKIKLVEPRLFSPKTRFSCKKNIIPLYPLNIISNKKINLAKKNTNTFKVRNNDKRKSYLSQGYRVKSKEYNTIIKNQSYCENEVMNEVPSSNNNVNENNSNYMNSKENNIKIEESKKSNNEFNPSFGHKKRKANLKINSNKQILEKSEKIERTDKNEGNSQLMIKNLNQEQQNLRHKSINYSNQKKFFRNSIFNKNHLVPKNSSELINDSSKQILVNNKNLLISLNYNKTQFDKNKIDENNNRLYLKNNNNTELANSIKNINLIANNNGNIEVLNFIKSIIKNKLKLEITEAKDSFAQNYLGKKIKFFQFFKSLFICGKKSENKIYLINNFRLKLLSEEHLYRNHINLYLIQKLFQIEDSYKFDIKEFYADL